MKTLIFFIFVVSANADYINFQNNHCVVNLTPNQNSTGYCFLDKHDNINYCDTSLNIDSFENGYTFETNTCLKSNDLQVTGLTQNQWDFLLAVLANVVGFTMLFLIGFLSVLISRK